MIRYAVLFVSISLLFCQKTLSCDDSRQAAARASAARVSHPDDNTASSEFEHIRELPDNSMTVGCNGRGSKLHGGLGHLMLGLHETIAVVMKLCSQNAPNTNMLKRCLKSLEDQPQERLHNHPGRTVDIIPRDDEATTEHIVSDWLVLDLEDNSVDAVFLEQLPPTGVISSRGPQDHSNACDDFLPRAIARARRALTSEGTIIIQLALDSHEKSSYTREDLGRKRAVNPFMGWFSDISGPMLQALQSGGEQGAESICKAIKFYLDKMTQRGNEVSQLITPYGRTKPMKRWIEGILASSIDDLKNTRSVSMADIRDPDNLDRFDIVSTVMKLMVVFRQGDQMLEYMNTNGFKDA